MVCGRGGTGRSWQASSFVNISVVIIIIIIVVLLLLDVVYLSPALKEFNKYTINSISGVWQGGDGTQLAGFTPAVPGYLAGASGASPPH